MGTHVFLRAIARRGVEVGDAVLLPDVGEVAQVVPHLVVVFFRPGLVVELVAGPVDGLGRLGIEVQREEEEGVFVIPAERPRPVERVLDHLARIGAVADEVAQAVDLVHLLRMDIRQHRFESFDVGVEIRD